MSTQEARDTLSFAIAEFANGSIDELIKLSVSLGPIEDYTYTIVKTLNTMIKGAPRDIQDQVAEPWDKLYDFWNNAPIMSISAASVVGILESIAACFPMPTELFGVGRDYCEVCYELAEDFVSCDRHDGHSYYKVCNACNRRSIEEQAFSDRQHIKCINCGVHLSYSDIKHFYAGKTDAERVLNVVAEKLANYEILSHCHERRLCEVLSKSSDQFSDHDSEAWVTQECQVCPDCLVLVRRETGCSHMTCRCGGEFCYFCGAPISPMGGYTCRCCYMCERPRPYLALWLRAFSFVRPSLRLPDPDDTRSEAAGSGNISAPKIDPWLDCWQGSARERQLVTKAEELEMLLTPAKHQHDKRARGDKFSHKKPRCEAREAATRHTASQNKMSTRQAKAKVLRQSRGKAAYLQKAVATI